MELAILQADITTTADIPTHYSKNWMRAGLQAYWEDVYEKLLRLKSE